ncbi:MAG: glutathione S-transferase [Alphaproteobacteria bacterium]|nr:glutathione S-transferase [Alphaproteobacteria bacterium]
MSQAPDSTTKQMPILYSYHECPFCIRARLAIAASGLKCELREVALPDKPAQLFKASAKGTVPVIVLEDGKVIDESMEIIHWALAQSDPLNWRQLEIPQAEIKALIDENDNRFLKAMLAVKKPEKLSEEDKKNDWEQVAHDFLVKLERKLDVNRYLAGNQVTLADICIVPFVLLYAQCKPDMLAEFSRVLNWVEGFRYSDLYRRVMQEYPAWHEGMEPSVFP